MGQHRVYLHGACMTSMPRRGWFKNVIIGALQRAMLCTRLTCACLARLLHDKGLHMQQEQTQHHARRICSAAPGTPVQDKDMSAGTGLTR